MNIGVLGGTFDPIHLGHLRVAEVARDRLALARILFVPAGRPWLKANNAISSAENRLEMVRLAIADMPYLQLSTMETERPGPTYTVDTIAQLQAQLNADDEIFFILGWDNLAQFPQWYQPSRLIEMCRLVAVPRVDYPPPDLASLDSALAGLSQRVVLLDEPHVDISASAIRQRVRDGLSTKDFVPEAVARYIKEHKLYLKQ